MGASGNRLGVLAAVLGAVVVLGGGFVAYTEFSERLAAKPPAGPVLAPAAPPAVVTLGQSLRETAERLDAPYRLGVDRRFRFARSELLGQGIEAPAEWPQEFTAEAPWSAERPFPRPLTFDEAFAQLAQLAGPPNPMATPTVVIEDPKSWISTPEAALSIIAQQTKTSSRPQDPLAAARAAISLLHGGVDRLSVADQLGGSALAWLALAERTRGEERSMERAVLALELGYAETATQLGRKLTGGAWKARLTFDDSALAAAPDAGLLWYQRQIELGRQEERVTWEGLPGNGRLGFAGVASGLRSNVFEAMGRSSRLCGIPLELHIAELSGADVKVPLQKLEMARGLPAMLVAIQEARGHLITLGALHLGIGLDTLSDLGRLDLWIQKASSRIGSPTAGSIFEKYSEALVSSCFGAFVDYRFDKQGIKPEEQAKMGREIFESKRPLFAQLKVWTELRALTSQSAGSSGQIVATAKTLDRLGGPAKARLARDLSRNIELNSPDGAALWQMLAESLDTRPSALREAAWLLAGGRYDLRYKDFFAEAWARAAASANQPLKSWWDQYRSASAQATVSDAPLREAELRGRLDPSIDDWAARQNLTKFLADEGRDAEIPGVVEPWLEAHRDDQGFGREWALCTLAEVDLRAGRAGPAWKTWEPLRESYKFSTIETGTEIALGRADLVAANQLSTRALTRYPNSPYALALRLRVLWTTGRADLARDVVTSAKKLPTLEALGPVRDAFIEIYGAKTPEEARQAAATLLESSITRSFIETLADHFRSKDLPAHCAAIFEIPSDSQLHQLQNDVMAYRCRKVTMGPAPALAWLEAKVPPPLRAPMVMFAFEQHLPELLWAPPQPVETEQNDDADYLWAVRAASPLDTGGALDPRVTAHFQKETRTDRYAAIGRYLTGFIDEKALLAAAITPRHANEIAYFLGRDAEIHHRVADAIVWYRASIETQEMRSHEYRLALFALHRLYNKGRSLAALQAEQDTPKPG